MGLDLGLVALRSQPRPLCLAAGVGAIAGLALGAVASFRRYDVLLLCATVGLFLSWYARTIFFGAIPGGWGALLMIGGVILSGAIGLYLSRQLHPALLPSLVGALYIGFFGGFFIDVIVLNKLLGWVHTHSILPRCRRRSRAGLSEGLAWRDGWSGGNLPSSEWLRFNSIIVVPPGSKPGSSPFTQELPVYAGRSIDRQGCQSKR